MRDRFVWLQLWRDVVGSSAPSDDEVDAFARSVAERVLRAAAAHVESDDAPSGEWYNDDVSEYLRQLAEHARFGELSG